MNISPSVETSALIYASHRGGCGGSGGCGRSGWFSNRSNDKDKLKCELVDSGTPRISVGTSMGAYKNNLHIPFSEVVLVVIKEVIVLEAADPVHIL